MIVSSLAHAEAKNGISFDDINFEKSFKTMEVYGQSKLANILHAKELAKRLEGSVSWVMAIHNWWVFKKRSLFVKINIMKGKNHFKIDVVPWVVSC